MTIWLRTTGSTMQDAAELAPHRESHGTVIAAEEQTDGIGRQGHSWYSERGGLYMSIIFRLKLKPDVLPVLTMAIGIATKHAVENLSGVSCDLRWPNDVLLNEKKLAGIMVQAADTVALIGGIGVNVNQNSFPEDLRGIATSLRIETGSEYSIEELLDRIVEGSLSCASLLARQGKRPILEQFEANSSYVRGKAVHVDTGFRTFSGTTAGLDENGFLLVETAAGTETVIAGGLRAASAP